MTFVATSIAGAAAVGFLGSQMQAGAARDAAAAQSAAADRANEVQRYMYDQTRADQAPWRDAGARALADIRSQLPDLNRKFTADDFQADPGYQFRMTEGQKAIERSAAARGGRLGGSTLKALTRYGQDTASNEYQNAYSRFTNDQNTRFNRLAALAGIGQTATGQMSQSNQNYANNVNQNMMGAANAQAAGTVGTANANAASLGHLGNSWMQYSMFNRMLPSTTPATNPWAGSGQGTGPLMAYQNK